MTRSATEGANSPDPAFSELAQNWTKGQVARLVELLWAGYEQLRASRAQFAEASLERSITEALERRVHDSMTGFEPFYVQHGSHEYETMAAPPAQPPQYDLAFVFRADERLKWPVEAKVLETPSATSDYVSDIQTEFETCRYGPFSHSGAMLGYLLSGEPAQVISNLGKKLQKVLRLVNGQEGRPHRASDHMRTVPKGKQYPATFECHHLIFDFAGVSRAETRNKKPSPKRPRPLPARIPG